MSHDLWDIFMYDYDTCRAKLSFQIDALNSPSDWPNYPTPRFDWLRAPSSMHQFQNQSKSSFNKKFYNEIDVNCYNKFQFLYN